MTSFIVPIDAPESRDAELRAQGRNVAVLGSAAADSPGLSASARTAYRFQLKSLGTEADARGVQHRRQCAGTAARRSQHEDRPEDRAIAPEILDPLLKRAEAHRRERALMVVLLPRSSRTARALASTGQFEASSARNRRRTSSRVRSCWGACGRHEHWLHGDPRPRSRRPAMAILVPAARGLLASGGGLSETADGGMLLSATWGLGSAIAQGEVTPDRYEPQPRANSSATIAGARTTRSAASTKPSPSRDRREGAGRQACLSRTRPRSSPPSSAPPRHS